MTLAAWIAELHEQVAAFGAEPAVGIEQAPDATLSKTVASNGFPGVIPLWSGRRGIVGLQADPNAPPQKWRGVILRGSQGLTLASDSRTLLPQFVISELLSNSPDRARRLAERWTDVGTRVMALHKSLGGDEQRMMVVLAAASDSATREEFKYKKDQEDRFEKAHSTLCRKVDDSESFAKYADWLDACISADWVAPAPNEGYGPWARRVLCWWGRLSLSQRGIPKPPSAALHPIVESEAGVDAGVNRSRLGRFSRTEHPQRLPSPRQPC